MGRIIFRAAIAGLCVVLALTAGSAVLVAATPDQSKPANALWWVVRGLCVNDQRFLGHPDPCLEVNLRQGWAVVKDPQAPVHLLLTPTRRLMGIESPQLLHLGEPNYWQFAWKSRPFLERLTRRPAKRDDLALVINAATGRTQNQLHIHLSCLKPKVARLLRDHVQELDDTWRPLSVRLLNHDVLVRRLNGADFGDHDPFKILATGVPAARRDMAAQSLSAVGMTFPDGRPGFVLIDRRANLTTGDLGSGEEILDFSCKILVAPPPSGA